MFLCSFVGLKVAHQPAGEESVKNSDAGLIGDAGAAPAVDLFIAASEEDPEALRRLIDTGADVNIQDNKGVAPLHIAAIIPSRRTEELM